MKLHLVYAAFSPLFLELSKTDFSIFQKYLSQVLVLCWETRWQNCADHWGQFWYRKRNRHRSGPERWVWLGCSRFQVHQRFCGVMLTWPNRIWAGSHVSNTTASKLGENPDNTLFKNTFIRSSSDWLNIYLFLHPFTHSFIRLWLCLQGACLTSPPEGINHSVLS